MYLDLPDLVRDCSDLSVLVCALQAYRAQAIEAIRIHGTLFPKATEASEATEAIARYEKKAEYLQNRLWHAWRAKAQKEG